MRLLLDTHAFLWFCEDDPQLSQTASAAIQSMENTVFVSAASLWEIAIKTSLGKLTLKRPFASLAIEVPATYEMGMLAVEPAHLVRLIGLPFHHRDPFDRLLAAQALCEGQTLISRDRVFDTYGVTRIWD